MLMRFLFAVLAASLLPVFGFANDASIALIGGSVRIVEADHVELVSEYLRFTYRAPMELPSDVGYRCDDGGTDMAGNGSCMVGAW